MSPSEQDAIELLLADAWDTEPVTPEALANELSWSVERVTEALRVLEQNGCVSNSPTGSQLP